MDQDQSLLTFVVAPPGETSPLAAPAEDYRFLFDKFGPSLALWRAAEVAALREQTYLMEGPILDLGCGDGLVTSLVLSQVDIGLDPDAHALRKAARLNVYRRLAPVSIQACGLPDGSIGTIISNSVLEHVADLPEALAASARLLRPGGRLIFTTPTEAFGPWLAMPFARYAAWRNRQLVHLNLWPLDRWEACLAEAGFEVEHTRPYMRRSLVRAWDVLDLLQMVWIGRVRLFGRLWRLLPAPVLDALARRASRVDLAARHPGGGRLVVARRV